MREIVDCIKEILATPGEAEQLVLEARKLDEHSALVRLPDGTEVPISGTATLDGDTAQLPWFVFAQQYLSVQRLQAVVELQRQEGRKLLRPLAGAVTTWCDSDGARIAYLAPSTRGWFEAKGDVVQPPEGARLRVTHDFRASLPGA